MVKKEKKRIEIIEDMEGEVWGSEAYADVDKQDHKRELNIYKVMKKHIKRKYKIIENGKKIDKSIDDKIKELEGLV